jgi:hypothetical protein
MCSCYIGTDVSSLVPVCPEQLLDTKFCRSIGMSECRNVGTSECRNIGIPEYWVRNPGKARFRPFGSRYTSARCSEVLIAPRFQMLRCFNCSEVPRFRGFIIFLGKALESPDAELYLRETLIFEFCFRVCGHTLIPHWPTIKLFISKILFRSMKYFETMLFCFLVSFIFNLILYRTKLFFLLYHSFLELVILE